MLPVEVPSDKSELVFLVNFAALWFRLHWGDMERTKVLSSSGSVQLQFKNVKSVTGLGTCSIIAQI